MHTRCVKWKLDGRIFFAGRLSSKDRLTIYKKVKWQGSVIVAVKPFQFYMHQILLVFASEKQVFLRLSALFVEQQLKIQTHCHASHKCIAVCIYLDVQGLRELAFLPLVQHCRMRTADVRGLLDLFAGHDFQKRLGNSVPSKSCTIVRLS